MPEIYRDRSEKRSCDDWKNGQEWVSHAQIITLMLRFRLSAAAISESSRAEMNGRIIDIGSSNGTIVSGENLTPNMPAHPEKK